MAVYELSLIHIYTGRLIDLRTPEEYNVSHLCEAENIPFLWLQDNRQTLTGLSLIHI